MTFRMALQRKHWREMTKVRFPNQPSSRLSICHKTILSKYLLSRLTLSNYVCLSTNFVDYGFEDAPVDDSLRSDTEAEEEHEDFEFPVVCYGDGTYEICGFEEPLQSWDTVNTSAMTSTSASVSFVQDLMCSGTPSPTSSTPKRSGGQPNECPPSKKSRGQSGQD